MQGSNLEDITLVGLDAEKNTYLTNSDVDLALRVEKLEIQKVETKFRKEELEGQKQDREERKTFANKIFYLLVVFLGISACLVFMSGSGNVNFHLSDSILVTILVTTTADVIGIFLFVVRYLFKSNHICPHCGKVSNIRKFTNTESILNINQS